MWSWLNMDIDKPPKEMTEEERIDFIRKYGSEQQKAGLKAVLNGNKYKIKRKEMWNTRLNKGIRMVQTIVNRYVPKETKKNKDKSSIMDYIE